MKIHNLATFQMKKLLLKSLYYSGKYRIIILSQVTAFHNVCSLYFLSLMLLMVKEYKQRTCAVGS